MLQENYGKHNLEMQPYHYYLSEYQNISPGDISSRLEIPFDENTRLFRVKFMERNYTVSHPDLEVHCLDEEDNQAVLCNDIHAKILLLRYFTEGDHMSATGSLLSYRDLPWGEVPPVLWKMYYETGQNVRKSAGYLSNDYGRIKRNSKRIWRYGL